MKDGPLRRAVKAVARWNYQLNLAAHRAWRRQRGERPYVLAGDCRRCARCCEEPGIQVGRLVWAWPRMRRLFLWWQRQVNGFELTRVDAGQRAFLFRCMHFDPATRACDSYDSRPGMCRDYPRLLLHQPRPEFLPGCGYRALAPNARALKLALEGRGLSEEQRARLAKELYLEE